MDDADQKMALRAVTFSAIGTAGMLVLVVYSRIQVKDVLLSVDCLFMLLFTMNLFQSWFQLILQSELVIL